MDDSHSPFGGFQNHTPVSGSSRGIVDRSQKTGLGRKVVYDLLLVPNVVTGGDDGGTGAQEVNGDFRRDPLAAGRVFAVDDDKIERLRLFQDRQLLDHRLAPGFTDNIA